ncbi:MAG: acireductone synthase [Crocinitomicaceae bacterium]|nr:acireductone synthase [Crocinitomicaceae bacterium]
MAILSIPEKNTVITNPDEIRSFFNDRGIYFDQWKCNVEFTNQSSQEEILAAYDKDLTPFMQKGGYKTADVINIFPEIENYDAIRVKFLAEHTHSEDEIRFFVDGQGLFWFNLETEPVFNLLCERGDLISVPAGTKHWFDAGEFRPFVKAIRIFIEMSGWTPHYTDTKIESQFHDFKIPLKHPVNYILTDIEGTTSSISFVTETLFPYFNENIEKLKSLTHLPEVQQAFEETKRLAKESENKTINTDDEIIAQLKAWSLADKKITPLKSVQGIIWDNGYKSGILNGHVYADVAPQFKKWQQSNIKMGVFSSGSIAAQKLLFGFSEAGDLTNYFSNYFDTTTGGKREAATYSKIATNLTIAPENILFLSDIVEELVAAKLAGFQTIQLVRQGNSGNWDRTAKDFNEVAKMIKQ